MEPKELYDKLEKLREIKKDRDSQTEKSKMPSGNHKSLIYNAVINSMPRSISFGDLLNYHNYIREMAEKRTEKAGRGY